MWHRLGKGGAKYWGKRGAGIIMTDGKSILLLKRGDKGDYAGHWCAPGGKVEDGETFLGGAQRETREETGSLPNCTRLATFDNQDGRFVFKSFLCRIDKPYEVKISDEHTDSKWVPLGELESMKLHPKFREILPSVLRSIKDKVGGTEINESVTRTGVMMRIGPYAIFEMDKYIQKHQIKLNEAWSFGGGSPPTPPPTPLAPRTVNPQVASFIPHIASALNLPTPLPPAVQNALTNIVSRVAPEPYGTGGMLQLNWFRTIMTSVWDAEAARAATAGDPVDPHSPTLAPAKNPVQILHAIRAEMPNEEFHSKVTLEGGGNKRGDEHDQHFMSQSRRYENEMLVKHKLRPGRGSKGSGGGGSGGGSGGSGGGGGGGSSVPQLDAKTFAFFKSLPHDVWLDGGTPKGTTAMANLMNKLAHGIGSAVTWGSSLPNDITQILIAIGVAAGPIPPPTPVP